jgi:hypothetical protein
VLNGDAFIAEDATQLVNLVKATYNQSLEMKFMGNAQVEILVKGMVVSGKGAGQGT